MDNTRARARKNRAEGKPFYLASGTTSAEIVAEARTSVRSLDTKRPCTPVEPKRTLFGANRSGASQSRPPSAFSIGPRHFAEPDLLSPTTPSNRLEPLLYSTDVPDGRSNEDHIVTQVDDKTKKSLTLSKCVEPLLPSDATASGSDRVIYPSPPKPSRPLNHLTVSRRSSTGNIVKQKLAPVKTTEARRARSGPVKRTSPGSSEGETRAKSTPVAGRQNNGVHSEAREENKYAQAKKSSEKTDKGPECFDRLSLTYKEHIRPILKEMDENLKKEDVKGLCTNCLELSAMLQREGVVPETKALGSPSFKGHIFKALFSYLALKNPCLHLRLAKIVLMFDVSESNEENIFKLIFKVSRDENNDQLFLEEKMTGLLIEKVAKFHENTKYEPWIYCTGALKLLSGNPSLRKDLVCNGCIEALGNILTKINREDFSNGEQKKKTTNLLIPVTAVLRNLADSNGSRELFLKHHILTGLVSILGTFKSDSDVALNICRILSKMTLYDECCSEVSSVSSCLEAFLRVLGIHLKSQEIVVRVLFILGNLTTKSDEIRYNLYFAQGSTKYLLVVFQTYFERNVEASKTDDNNHEKNTERERTEDVLNKIVRVVANLSIHTAVGPEIAKNSDFVDLLVQILEIKDLSSSEELVLNTVATINNLSYYTDENSALADKRRIITQLLMGLMVAENMDAILEASRVFGNFSRFKEVRDILSNHKVDEMMISLLDSGNHEIVYTACGVLINLMVDFEKRPVLKDEGGIKKLIDVLRDFGKIDWQLAAMVCQTLWNYCESMRDVYEAFGEEETLTLNDLLREYLDEETAFDFANSRKIEPSVQQLLRDTWKDNFEMVGEHLLQRIESQQSDLLPLEEPS